jgi:hypothetical protein
MNATVTKLRTKSSPKPKLIPCLVDGEQTSIPVSRELNARYHELFYRELPSDLQKRRLKALKRLMAAAYRAGRDAN